LIGGQPSRIFDFAPDEACLSDIVANAEVGSYPAFSPLSNHFSGQTVYFLWRCLSPITEARELPGIMPCGARTFLLTEWSGGSLVHRRY